VKGNLFFMSPEQARAQEVDSRSDLFSLGMVLYTAATGDTLYHGSTSYELLARAGLGPTAADFELIGRLPGGLGPLIARALQPDPAARFQDADQFARAVSAVGPIASAADLQTLMEWLFKDALAAETTRLSRPPTS
jgi:serine/threonine-protein kinase